MTTDTVELERPADCDAERAGEMVTLEVLEDEYVLASAVGAGSDFLPIASRGGVRPVPGSYSKGASISLERNATTRKTGRRIWCYAVLRPQPRTVGFVSVRKSRCSSIGQPTTCHLAGRNGDTRELMSSIDP